MALTVNIHPMVFAAWFGMLATALNLLPFGQIDGGHITYATLGRWSTPISVATVDERGVHDVRLGQLAGDDDHDAGDALLCSGRAIRASSTNTSRWAPAARCRVFALGCSSSASRRFRSSCRTSLDPDRSKRELEVVVIGF